MTIQKLLGEIGITKEELTSMNTDKQVWSYVKGIYERKMEEYLSEKKISEKQSEATQKIKELNIVYIQLSNCRRYFKSDSLNPQLPNLNLKPWRAQEILKMLDILPKEIERLSNGTEAWELIKTGYRRKIVEYGPNKLDQDTGDKVRNLTKAYIALKYCSKDKLISIFKLNEPLYPVSIPLFSSVKKNYDLVFDDEKTARLKAYNPQSFKNISNVQPGFEKNIETTIQEMLSNTLGIDKEDFKVFVNSKDELVLSFCNIYFVELVVDFISAINNCGKAALSKCSNSIFERINEKDIQRQDRKDHFSPRKIEECKTIEARIKPKDINLSNNKTQNNIESQSMDINPSFQSGQPYKFKLDQKEVKPVKISDSTQKLESIKIASKTGTINKPVVETSEIPSHKKTNLDENSNFAFKVGSHNQKTSVLNENLMKEKTTTDKKTNLDQSIKVDEKYELRKSEIKKPEPKLKKEEEVPVNLKLQNKKIDMQLVSKVNKLLELLDLYIVYVEKMQYKYLDEDNMVACIRENLKRDVLEELKETLKNSRLNDQEKLKSFELKFNNGKDFITKDSPTLYFLKIVLTILSLGIACCFGLWKNEERNLVTKFRAVLKEESNIAKSVDDALVI